MKYDTISDIVRIILMWIVSVLRETFGKYDSFLITLIIFVSADYISGIFVAISARKLSSRIGYKGILKKFGIFCVIAITAVIEQSVFEMTGLCSAVILYYISNEGISILENLCRLGVPIPNKLHTVFLSLQDEDLEKR